MVSKGHPLKCTVLNHNPIFHMPTLDMSSLKKVLRAS